MFVGFLAGVPSGLNFYMTVQTLTIVAIGVVVGGMIWWRARSVAFTAASMLMMVTTTGGLFRCTGPFPDLWLVLGIAYLIFGALPVLASWSLRWGIERYAPRFREWFRFHKDSTEPESVANKQSPLT